MRIGCVKIPFTDNEPIEWIETLLESLMDLKCYYDTLDDTKKANQVVTNIEIIWGLVNSIFFGVPDIMNLAEFDPIEFDSIVTKIRNVRDELSEIAEII